jgi:hypothetical protein
MPAGKLLAAGSSKSTWSYVEQGLFSKNPNDPQDKACGIL